MEQNVPDFILKNTACMLFDRSNLFGVRLEHQGQLQLFTLDSLDIK
jgi:hypothetical protein